MNYRILALKLLLFTPHLHAIDISNYCQQTHEQRELSKEAIENKGMYTSRHRFAGEKTPRIVKKRYLGCRYDTPWLDKIYSNLCEGETVKTNYDLEDLRAIKTPDVIVFFFDGFSDFNASLGKRQLNAVNLDGSEGSDLGLGNANGQRIFNQALTKLSHELPDIREKIEIHYHPGSGLHKRESYSSAVACADQSKLALDLIELITGDSKQTKWAAMGFSNGGYLAIDFQNEVPDYGINIDLAFSIDPVSQSHYYPFNMLKDTIGKKNNQTKKFVNYFQDTDHSSVPVFSLRGKAVVDADINVNLAKIPQNELSEDGKRNHVQMTLSTTVRKSIACEVATLLDFPSVRDCL